MQPGIENNNTMMSSSSSRGRIGNNMMNSSSNTSNSSSNGGGISSRNISSNSTEKLKTAKIVKPLIPVRATLIVVPPTLVGQWWRELHTRVDVSLLKEGIFAILFVVLNC